MPRWQSHRDLLNPLPVRREKWVYCVLTTTVPCIDLIVFPSRTTVVLLYSCRSPRAECQMRAISQSARSRSTRYTMRYGRKIISRILSSLYSGTTRPNSGNSCRRSVSEISSNPKDIARLGLSRAIKTTMSWMSSRAAGDQISL